MNVKITFFIALILLAGCGTSKEIMPNQTVAFEEIQPNQTEPVQTKQPEFSDDEPPLKLKSIGFNLGYYDSATNRAGDLQFTKKELYNNKVWEDFGQQDSRSPNDPSKRNPQPTFFLPLGTKVESIVDGIVVRIPQLYSGDYSIHVAEKQGSRWSYEMEHVINPLVKVGDTVKAGQIIAEVSTHGSHNEHGLGLFEIGILKGGNPPQHICPFAYLDESIKTDVESKITALYRAWEEYKGDDSIYDEAAMASPGCVNYDEVEG